MISWEHAVELVYQPLLARRISNRGQLEAFGRISPRYTAILEQLAAGLPPSQPEAVGYAWGDWVASVRAAFRNGVPLDFLSHPTLRHTMVFSRRRGVVDTRVRAEYVRDVLGESITRRLLIEDPVGGPMISSARWLTSANRAHHAAHIATYSANVGANFWDAASIVEWGGGYGNMARLLRRLNPGVTYVIVDLPEMLALQYVYLAATEGESNLHIVDPATCALARGRINLVAGAHVERLTRTMRSDAFISTWALTESPIADQEMVGASGFFGASRVLLGSMRNANNVFTARADAGEFLRVPTLPSRSIGAGNEYWLK